MNDQTAKADAGKAPLSLVPRRIIFDIAQIREYGNKKYHDPNNWKNVEVERYRDAAFRHLLAYLDDPSGVDEESGLPHYWHLACNVAFICEIEDGKICSPGFCPEVKMRDIKRKEVVHNKLSSIVVDKKVISLDKKEKEDVEYVIRELIKIAESYGYASVADVKDICGLPLEVMVFTDQKYGWNYETLKDLQPQKEPDCWTLVLPDPVKIQDDITE